ncbi:MAG: YdcF family protein [Desulfomonile tiedjei]|nr:YdcF family protein [Desulfomonile tiedjei]
MMQWDLFQFKKTISWILHPLNFWLVITALGVVVCLWKPRKAAGWTIVLAGFVWLFVTSLPGTGYLLFKSLELRAGCTPDAETLRREGIRFIVVLGNEVEGARLWQELPDSKLVLSSGQYALAMADKVRVLGIPHDSLVLETEARDTEEQARKLQPLLRGERFVLCTWAIHMPRALMAFRLVGLNPVPAPTDFVTFPAPLRHAFFPCSSGQAVTAMAFKEYWGTVWLALKSAVAHYTNSLLNR